MTHIHYRTPLATNGNGTHPRLRAVIHPRVSTDEQAEEGYSLDEQERLGRDLCQREDMEVVAVIPDDYTGRTLNRPGLNQITELSRRGGFDVLVCVKTSRLARKANLQQSYEEVLKKRGQRVRYVEQQFEDNKSGRLFRRFQGNIDEYQWEDLREETMSKRAAKAKDGRAPSGVALYGYHQITMAEAKVIPEYAGRDGHWVIDEGEAKVVRKMFQLCASGMGPHAIAVWLRDNGIRSRTGKVFAVQVIRGYLRSETYLGRFYWGTATHTRNDEPEVDPLTGRMEPKVFSIPNPRESWTEIAVPAIIPRELWEAAQAVLDRNAESGRGRPSDRWLLTGALFCADCRREDGRRVSWCGCYKGPGRTRPIYYCATKARPDLAGCGGTINADALEASARKALEKIAMPGALERIQREESERRRKAAGQPAREADRLKKQLAEVDTRLGRMSESILAGTPRRIVEKQIQELNEEADRLIAAIREAEKQIAYPDADAAALAARDAAEHLHDQLEDIGQAESAEERRRLKELIRQFLTIEVGRGRTPVFIPRVPCLVERVEMEAFSSKRFQFYPASAPLELPRAA